MPSADHLLPDSHRVRAEGPVAVHETTRAEPGRVLLKLPLNQTVAPAWRVHFAVAHHRSDPMGAAVVVGEEPSVLVFESRVEHTAVQEVVDLLQRTVLQANILYAYQAADLSLEAELELDGIVLEAPEVE